MYGPPASGYRAASSPKVSAPASTNSPQTAQTPIVSAGEASAPMMSAGVRKMPTAMVWPTTNAVADHNPSPPEAAARVMPS